MATVRWLVVVATAFFGDAAVAGKAEAVLRVKVEMRDRTPTQIADRALAVASGIYRRADVPIELTTDQNGGAAITIVVLSAATTKVHPAGDSLGVAPSFGDGTRGSVAYVFADRAQRFARAGRVALADVLGCAIAHELGHLLLPVNAHARDGIMRANWDPSFIPRNHGALPEFTPDQAYLLRLRVAGRIASP